jgi:hypothetical protein
MRISTRSKRLSRPWERASPSKYGTRRSPFGSKRLTFAATVAGLPRKLANWLLSLSHKPPSPPILRSGDSKDGW